MLIRAAVTDHWRDIIRFEIDLRVSARVYFARLLWLHGFLDQAVRTAEVSVEEAQATGHALSLCYALALTACPITLWLGNLAAAAHYAGMLLEHSKRHSLPLSNEFGSSFQKAIVIEGGRLDTGLRLLQAKLNEIAEPYFSFRVVTALVDLAEPSAYVGRIAEGLAWSKR